MKLISNHPFCKHSLVHLLSFPLAYNPPSLSFVDQPCVRHMSVLMSFHPQLFNMLDKCLIFVEAIVVAILIVARPKECLHFLCAILPNLQPLRISTFVTKILLICKLTMGHLSFFVKYDLGRFTIQRFYIQK